MSYLPYTESNNENNKLLNDKLPRDFFLSEGFVYLDEINDKIVPNLMYNTEFNFVGEKIDSYDGNRVILTKKAAEALDKAWQTFDQDGYNIVIYDAYRPQEAVDHFKRWARDGKHAASEMKKYFFPYIEHRDAFDKGYIAEKSSHSRGSTVDMTIIEKNSELIKFSDYGALSPVVVKLADGREVYNLNDGTVDMGTSVDLMDEASHPYSNLVSSEVQQNREYLIKVMGDAGFEVYEKEWWHFTLKNEPYLNTYFNFNVE